LALALLAKVGFHISRTCTHVQRRKEALQQANIYVLLRMFEVHANSII
jgi:hypothetical protein